MLVVVQTGGGEWKKLRAEGIALRSRQADSWPELDDVCLACQLLLDRICQVSWVQRLLHTACHC